MSPNKIDRRLFIRNTGAVVGTGSVIGLAGCLSDIGGNGNENTSASSDSYPEEDVEIVVPFASGGGFDAYARLSEPYWSETLDGDVVVSNVTGGGGVIGATQVYNASPDGHRILIWDVYQSVTQQIARDVDFDIREMSHIGTITNDPNAMLVMDHTNIEDWDDFINRISEFSFGTQGSGSSGHTLVALFTHFLDDVSPDDLNFVHFDGTGEVLAGLERGEADIFMPSTVTSTVDVVKSLEGGSMFVVFEQQDEIGWYLDDQGIESEYYSPDLDIDDIETFNELSYMRRFFTGPPGVSEGILETQREAFLEFTSDDEFVNSMEENGRPVINPGDAQQTTDAVNQLFETFEQEPYQSLFNELIN